MRVLVLTNMYPPHHYGGYEQSCHDVVGLWQAGGHEVSVLTTSMRVAGVAAPDDPGVTRALRFYWDDHRLLSPPPWTRLAWEWHNHRALASVLDDLRPDVVSVWNMGAMSLSLLSTIGRRRIPQVFVVCDDWLLYGPRLDAWTRMFAERPALGRAVSAVTGLPCRHPAVGQLGACCFVSDTTRRRAETAGVYPVAGVVLSGIGSFGGPGTSRPWGGELLYVGRIDERKGLDSLVDAMAMLPEYRLTVLGSGDAGYAESLRRRAPSVSWDAVPRCELGDRYRAADAVVFPSVWDEPFGLVPVEAMSCGTPVVATGTGGSGEFLKDGYNSVLFPAGSAASLAAAVRRLGADRGLRERIVAGGLATAGQLGVDALARCLEEWHLGAIAGFPDGPPPDRAILLG